MTTVPAHSGIQELYFKTTITRHEGGDNKMGGFHNLGRPSPPAGRTSDNLYTTVLNK